MARPIPSARMTLVIGVVLAHLLLAGAEATLAQPAPGSAALTGAAAWHALLGNTISGRTPDGPYTEYYKPDGTVVHIDRDGKDVGRWVLKDPSICFTYTDDDDDECRGVEVEGGHGAFVDPGGARYRFDILPGNPNGL